MIEAILDIATRDGAMETFVVRPERGGPYPPVLFLMDAPGIREELYDMARRLASVGYFVVLPNLYYRAGRDTKYMIAWLDARDDVKKGPVGIHGYCMSGPYALAAAARYPDRIAAAASFYGTWLVSDNEESPHLTLGQAKGELYISCAEHDDLAPPDMVAELKKLFDASGARGELEIHPGVHHGFAFPQRWCYDRPAAERHWERLIALYRRNLG